MTRPDHPYGGGRPDRPAPPGERTVHRYEVPADGQWHDVDLSGPIVHAAARRPDVIELWALTGTGLPRTHQLRVFTDDEPLPGGPVKHRGTVPGADGARHLFEAG